MDRIVHPTAVDIGGGRRGFRSKDTVAGLPGTVLTAAHLNAEQEEILAVIEASGQVPNGADLTQLLKALRLMTAGNLRTVVLTAASGNFLVPADCSVLNWVRRVGGGGAGGNSGTSASKAGGAGGGAGCDDFNLPVTPGASLPYTVGPGGVPHASQGFSGGNGGSTAFLGVTCAGGIGGNGANNSVTAIQVGGGQVTSGAPAISYPGGLGTEGSVGTGGGSVLSQPTQRAFTNAGNNNAANNWGGGGPGGSDFGGAWQPGGAGKPGIIIVQYFSRFAP